MNPNESKVQGIRLNKVESDHLNIYFYDELLMHIPAF
jgi:hypothetical protein